MWGQPEGRYVYNHSVDWDQLDAKSWGEGITCFHKKVSALRNFLL